jgi:hypothetical protein
LFLKVDNSSSSTFIDLGHNTFNYSFGPLGNVGDYFSDTLTIGSFSIKNQTMGSSVMGDVPTGLLGTGFPSNENGAAQGRIAQYPTFLQNMVSQGAIESATQSIWLNPSQGADDSPDSFPTGSVIFGGIDTALFDGHFTTVPVVGPNSTAIQSPPVLWNVALTSLQLGTKDRGTRPSFIASDSGDSCVLSTGLAFNLFTNNTFNALIAAFPEAVFNASTMFYELPCSQRFNASNSLSFTFSDPMKSNCMISSSITITIPATETIWPNDRLMAGGDPNICSIAAASFPEVLPSYAHQYACILGDSMMKSAYWVFDMENEEISIARAIAKRVKKGQIISVPKQGVRGLKY